MNYFYAMKNQLSFHEKYQIVLNRDISYEGIFITAVKTTGIFCRPGCTAKTPKAENVVFYNSTTEAILNGYRPCKVCRPMESADETPNYITNILKELDENPFLKIKDYDLMIRDIEPNAIRRWFKNHYSCIETNNDYETAQWIFDSAKSEQKIRKSGLSSGANNKIWIGQPSGEKMSVHGLFR